MFGGGIGGTEILLIFLVVLILFGSKRIPDIAQGLGRGIKDFKRAVSDTQKEINDLGVSESSKSGRTGKKDDKKG
jgi:TatA/E family protein of Tat protein translocase